MIDSLRIQPMNRKIYKGGGVAYWMSREQRVDDNWGLLEAQRLAKKEKSPLYVIFCLVPDFLGAARRQYEFMVQGLKEVEDKLHELNIPFVLLAGEPAVEIPNFITEHDIGALVSDFDPLRIKRQWQGSVNSLIDIPFSLVDSHNIVPCWAASPKREYGAYTIRKKIMKQLFRFLTDLPELENQKQMVSLPSNDWEELTSALVLDETVKPVTWLESGMSAARETFELFLTDKISHYAAKRNDPNADVQSNLSPYLHFGQISAQRIALLLSELPTSAKEDFWEQLIIRKELSDNFCYYNSSYDSFEGLPEWAQKNHDDHRHDEREFLYTIEEFEGGETHDDLWNAAQLEMVKTGKMHGYMRMYWAKKILEWSESPEAALQIAITLNDKYQLDGRDPNGYTGIMWSIGGVHDRPWSNRPVFGKIRYMNYNGCKRKFDVNAYISKMQDT